MFARVMSAAIYGVEAVPVEVEADVSSGLPGFAMVGFLSSQVREAQERVRTAMKNTDLDLPPKKITINLSPADIRKEGSRFDLPIALAILCSTDELSPDALDKCMVAGELSLDGRVRPVTGILATALRAKEDGAKTLIIPADNVEEASLVDGLRVIGAHTLRDVLLFLKEGREPYVDDRKEEEAAAAFAEDFADIHGQADLKRAALIAVAGFHNILMIGPPGAGKTMVARRLPTILPPLQKEESLEIARIHSIAGLFRPELLCGGARPFRSPHHTISPNALAGGGKVPSPGEITLAHRGVLFLDEIPEFQRRALEILRQPLEDREIVIARTQATFRFPADILLAAAMNPCPCGYYPDMRRCTCSLQQIQHYRGKISRPLLDRIDVCAQVPRASYDALKQSGKDPVSSDVLRKDVMRVFAIQQERFGGTKIRFNAGIPASMIAQYCPMEKEAEQFLSKAFAKLQLSARAYHRILKVARTIADLGGSKTLTRAHIEEAVFYRMGEVE